MGSKDGQVKVLDYHDVLLRAADLQLLQPGQWLNDQIISFFFEWLTHEQCLEQCTSGHILFLPPSTSFLAGMCGPEEAAAILAPLELGSKQVVVAAVNDNADVSHAGGGSHWSLLVYESKSGTFRHYDSSSGSGNSHAAKQLAAALQGAGCGTGSKVKLVDVASMPKQQNGHDCGVYACAVAQTVGSWVAQGCGCSDGEQGLRSELTTSYVTELRAHILQLIQERQR